jgi:hypothetical protein
VPRWCIWVFMDSPYRDKKVCPVSLCVFVPLLNKILVHSKSDAIVGFSVSQI